MTILTILTFQAASLPASLLPQFQMYRWAFVREGATTSNNNNAATANNNNGLQQQDFVPHIARIAKLLENKVAVRSWSCENCKIKIYKNINVK